jgi:hypothetical protein
MKKYLSILAIPLFICAVVYSGDSQETVNLVGTWIGPAVLEGQPDNELTLVMEEKEGKLAGTVTGEYGTLVDTPLENIKLEKNVFSFDIIIDAQGTEIKAVFKMTVEGDKMEGEFEIPDMGAGGTWSAERSK